MSKTPHTWVRHEDCRETFCHICDGGLMSCTVCNGGEGSLPTDCPGTPMTADQQDAVLCHQVDFVDGAWVDLTAAQRTQRLAGDFRRADALAADQKRIAAAIDFYDLGAEV